MKSYPSSSEIVTCPICLELDRSPVGRFASALPTENSICCESDTFVVLPSLGALVVGHSLIVTREHANSILLSASVNRMEELNILIARVCNKLSCRFGDNFLVFEHGSIREHHELCSTSHAHLHILPFPKYAIKMIATDCVKTEFLSENLTETQSCARNMGDFIFMSARSGNGSFSMANTLIDAKNLPSQYVRREVSRILGLPNWNWRDDLALQTVRATIEALGSNADALRV